MKKIALATLTACCIIVFFSCDNTDNMATLNIDLGANAAILPQQNQHDSIIDRVLRFFSSPAYAAPAAVKLIVVKVTGKGMVPAVKAFAASTLIASLTVPEGEKRLVLVKGYNGSGRVIYSGKYVINLKAGEIKTVSITMRPVLRQVADINTVPGTGSSPSGFTLVNKKVYFSADDDIHGRELWVYDPLTDAVEMVADVYPGDDGSTPYSSNPVNLTAFQGKLCFTAYNGTAGNELFVYNPEDDSLQTFDLYPGINVISGFPNASIPANLTVIGEKLYFSAYPDPEGPEPFVYNGVDEPFYIDVLPTSLYGSNPAAFTKYGPAVCFTATDYSSSYIFLISQETDGILDQQELPYNYPPLYLKAFNGRVYFCIYSDLTYNERLYYYEPGNAPLELEIFDGATPYNFIGVTEMAVLNNNMYIASHIEINPVFDPEPGMELWRYNGSVPADLADGDVSLTADINPTGDATPRNLTPVDRALYFQAQVVDAQYWLYAYVPILDNAFPIIQIDEYNDSIRNLGGVISFSRERSNTDIYVFNPLMPISAVAPQNPYRLPLDAINAVPSGEETKAIGNILFFSGGIADGPELWVFEYYE